MADDEVLDDEVIDETDEDEEEEDDAFEEDDIEGGDDLDDEVVAGVVDVDVVDDVVADGDDEEDVETEAEAEAKARRAKSGEDDEDDDDEADPDDVEEDLDTILRDRIAAGADDDGHQYASRRRITAMKTKHSSIDISSIIQDAAAPRLKSNRTKETR